MEAEAPDESQDEEPAVDAEAEQPPLDQLKSVQTEHLEETQRQHGDGAQQSN